MLLSKWAVGGCTKLKVIKKQLTTGLWSNLGLKVPLSKIHLLSLFWRYKKMKK